MQFHIDITGFDRRALIREAYALSRPQGMGHLHFTPGPLPDDQVEEIATSKRALGGIMSMDYVNGRAVKLHVRTENGRDWIRNAWFDHTPEELRELLRRIGMPEKASEVSNEDPWR